MADSVVLTKTTAGSYYIVEEYGASQPNEKPFTRADFTVLSNLGLIKLVPPPEHYAVMAKAHPPEEWTVGTDTGFTTVLQVTEAITALANL